MIYFTKGQTYTVISFIKLHTKFDQNVHTIRVGRFVKETDEQYFFDKFYVRKSNIVKIIEGDLLKEYGVKL